MNDQNKPLISLKEITKIFQTEEVETHALSGVDMEVRDGEYVAVDGPSGCGKSTLLSIMGLLDTSTSGLYQLKQQDVTQLSLSQRARIRNRQVGFIFQSFNLIGDLTVQENVQLPLSYRGMSSSDQKKLTIEALEKVAMTHRRQHYPAQLSGGQQQRVAVARAIVGNPAILLADEPTGNLDSKNAEAVMKLLADLHSEGSTICMVTHDPRWVHYADRTIHLFDGQIVAENETMEAK
ncbi:MAG: ABC transporter ATP-binding protein [Phycisphaerales bacterium]|nr:MAG: ABC transporter ATP-binding protein [Phycisphaerales bacterium]